MNGPGYDPGTHLGGGVSLPVDTQLTGSSAANGAAVDCGELQGPVYAEFQTGEAGSDDDSSDGRVGPTSYTVTGKIQESADGLTNWADCAVQNTVVLTDDSQAGYARAIRTKRYCRAVATPAFTGGTNPYVYVAGTVRGQKIRS